MKKGIMIFVMVFVFVICGVVLYIFIMDDSNQFEEDQNMQDSSSEDIILHEWTFSERYLNLLIENMASETITINEISSFELLGASDCTLERGTGDLVPTIKKVARLQCNGWEDKSPFSIKIVVVYTKNEETKEITFPISDTVNII